MSAREDILTALREGSKELLRCEKDYFSMPSLSNINVTVYDNPIEKFKEISKTVSGANVVESSGRININDIIAREYPDAKTIGSNSIKHKT